MIYEHENLSVRELQESDIAFITDYWKNADADFLHGMGVDLSKLPSATEWNKMLAEQLAQDYPDKNSYCLILLHSNEPVGHTNVNKIIFGVEAFMHLHIWREEIRNLGFGTRMIKLALPYFFKNLQLKTIYCEPYALNPAPNRALEKLRFEFIKEYVTTPGFLNFEQPVKRWALTKKRFEQLNTINR